MSSKESVLSLYRAILREGKKFHNYNLREYVKRRARDGFRENQGTTDAQQISSALKLGLESLEVIKRQAIVYTLYARPMKNVIELGKEAIQ